MESIGFQKKGIGIINPETKRVFYKNLNNKNNRISYSKISEDGTIWVFMKMVIFIF